MHNGNFVLQMDFQSIREASPLYPPLLAQFLLVPRGRRSLPREPCYTGLILPPLSIMTIYTVDSGPYFAVIVLLLYLGLVQKQAGKLRDAVSI